MNGAFFMIIMASRRDDTIRISTTKSFEIETNATLILQYLRAPEHIIDRPDNADIDNFLGKGLTARVFGASEKVIKIFHDDDLSKDCMRREANFLAKVLPNIVRSAKCNLFAVDEEGNVSEIEFDENALPPLQTFVDFDESRRQLTTKPRGIPLKRESLCKVAISPIILDMFNVLTIIHAAGYVQGDFSQHNVILVSGRAVLIDFGFSRAATPHLISFNLVCFCMAAMYWIDGERLQFEDPPMTRDECAAVVPEGPWRSAFLAALDRDHGRVLTEVMGHVHKRGVQQPRDTSPHENIDALRSQHMPSPPQVDAVKVGMDELSISGGSS